VNKDPESIFGPVVSVYTREQAIADGVLVDVTKTAKEAGFTVPVAVTDHVWGEVITPRDQQRSTGQSEAGRLWDVLSVLRYAVKASQEDGALLLFKVLMQDAYRHYVQLKSEIGPGDHGEPVITIMLPGED